ncbi:UDP-4-amino-4,6-dideoxy-N-acetyl-beta-L-altrosamine transaminase [Anianabacter salinae]|uniref:UDP-4-amino-4, 6-dideoxy-N-acetyl-beta-L-altrosamine transaminase n=1 Tax=Anianabacter salinae TaxID=2851023 RepID=UPI00225DE97D|nr:UDP-4-amino-4,6-dideoxy-N-acetyl-beta-L-altrosamine transaminase [Anianabacter salinae]MBV0914161.1 UDP-4-amino-4,6-dideoxy-N-acetyl-beta-L-altrosamine transaminase [Anianabacter salinae]
MIPYGKHHIDEDDIQAVVDVLRGDWLTQGPQVDMFEAAFKAYTGAEYAVAVSSATAGLHLAAMAAGLSAGDTLVTSPITFVATANAARYTGANVAFADIDSATLNMSPEALDKVLSQTPGAKMVVPVHFGGLPCDMEAISAVAKRHGCLVVEDAAHALGGTYADGNMVGEGGFSHMSVFSFHPVKAIAAGEGGMIATNDEALYRRLIRLRSHGMNKLDDPFLDLDLAFDSNERNPWYYEMQELGFNYRITDLQCALGTSQLAKLPDFVARRRALAARYDTRFAEFSHIKPAQPMARDRSGLHLYVARFDFHALCMTRREVMLHLRAQGITTQVHYIPVPAHPYYRAQGFDPQDYPASWGYYHECLSLPLFYDLTDDQQDHIVGVLKGLDG